MVAPAILRTVQLGALFPDEKMPFMTKDSFELCGCFRQNGPLYSSPRGGKSAFPSGAVGANRGRMRIRNAMTGAARFTSGTLPANCKPIQLP